eukprot:430876-Pyramimonas_sp.AAC.1
MRAGCGLRLTLANAAGALGGSRVSGPLPRGHGTQRNPSSSLVSKPTRLSYRVQFLGKRSVHGDRSGQ